MTLPGARYRELARRCRLGAATAPNDRARAGLMIMADGYERRASEAEAKAFMLTGALPVENPGFGSPVRAGANFMLTDE